MITFPPLISTLTYVRDTITVNEAFFAELTTQIDEKNLAAGSTITIAARVITHAPGYVLRLTNYKLIVIADEYDAAGGSIDVSGTNGANGAKGADGQKGYASATDANCKDGKPGATGGNGAPGTSGMQVQLYCKRLKAAKLLSCGGSGGNGGPGGKGGDGGNAVVVRTDPEGGKYNEYVGTAGGNGGKGGNASVGGAGGQITVRYIQRLGVLAPSATVIGGTGGTGGLGGAAGKGFYGEPDGTPGTKGANSAKGSNGTTSVQQVQESAYWQQVRAAIGDARAFTWAQYRTRLGEYFLRCFVPSQADTYKYAVMASNEFRSVLWLHPLDAKAQVMLGNMAANLTPTGVPRDLYVTPDFPRYEQAFTDYAPMVLNIVDGAKDLLIHASNVQHNREKLAAQIAHIQASAIIVESERAEAAVEKLQAEGAVAGYDGRIASLEAEIDQKRAELAEARLEIGGQFICSVLEAIVAIAAVVGAAYTGGASLAALPGLLVAAQDKWGSLTVDENGQVMYQDCYLTDWVEWEDGKPKLKPEIQALGAGMEKVVKSVQPAINSTLDLIDKAKVLGEIGSATVDDELQNELKELLRRKAELEFERAQAKLGVKQAELRLATIELKAQQAQADLAAAQQMLDNLTADNKLLGRVTAMLVRRAQEYMTHLQQFQFWATRALDIYALKNYTSSMRFDIGYVHPDVEEDAYTAFGRGEGTRALQLMEAYLNSWSQLPGIIVLRNEYESYRMDLLTQSQFWSFSGNDPVLDAMRQKGSAEFEIPLSEIYEDRYECKIEGVSIALVGAASVEPAIQCAMIHRGDSSVALMSGGVAYLSYPPRGCPLPAVKTAAEIDNAPQSPPEAFWGRSPAAKWRLYVEPAALQNANLSGMTEVLISFSYKAFIPPLQSVQSDEQVVYA